MIADRYIFVVGQQRLVGPELFADVVRVMDADIEVGVIADEAWNVQPDFALSDQLRLDVVAKALVGQELGQTQAKLPLCLRSARQPCVEHRLRQILAPLLVEQIRDSRKVEHIIANGYSRPPTALRFREDAE